MQQIRALMLRNRRTTETRTSVRLYRESASLLRDLFDTRTPSLTDAAQLRLQPLQLRTEVTPNAGAFGLTLSPGEFIAGLLPSALHALTPQGTNLQEVPLFGRRASSGNVTGFALLQRAAALPSKRREHFLQTPSWIRVLPIVDVADVPLALAFRSPEEREKTDPLTLSEEQPVLRVGAGARSLEVHDGDSVQAERGTSVLVSKVGGFPLHVHDDESNLRARAEAILRETSVFLAQLTLEDFAFTQTVAGSISLYGNPHGACVMFEPLGV